jgi:hypothetical protein
MNALALLAHVALGATRPDKFLAADARVAISRMLNDPASAQYQNLRVEGDKICGEVNARNRAGGYDGFMTFYGVIEANGTVTIRELDKPDQYETAKASCYKAGL